MKNKNTFSRRLLVKSSVLGIISASLPNIVYSRNLLPEEFDNPSPASTPDDRYPAIQLQIASEVVGVSHFNLDRLKELVEPRPELAKADWDWGFGDWESAIGAASHVGRKDIVEYLISKGAVPTIFTYAMLGKYEVVKSMIEAYPGLQRNFGPHGITILQHAKTGLETEGVDRSNSQRLIDYLQSLSDTEERKYLKMEETEMSKYLGDYKYGKGKGEGFTIKTNMRKLLSLGKIGKSGGTLWRTADHEFAYQGAPSVTVKFIVQGDHVAGLTVIEPGLKVTATKI